LWSCSDSCNGKFTKLRLTVNRRAHDLIQDSKIAARIEQLRVQELARINFEYLIDKEKVIREYLRIALVDIRKLFDDSGRLKDIHELDDDTAAAIASIEVTSSLDGEIPTYTHKIKLLDKRQPLQDLAKMLGLFEKDNDQQAGKDRNLNLQVNFIEPER
jgi:phage terminase small subunit